MPFGLVLLTEDQGSVLKHLFENKIVGEIQWELTNKIKAGKDATWLANHNIMLQCDQRYAEDDMYYIADTLSKYRNIN